MWSCCFRPPEDAVERTAFVEAFSHRDAVEKLAALSCRSPRNLACLNLPSAVHSTNRICATSSGRAHRISPICSAVIPPPQRDVSASGRLTKGQTTTRSGFSRPRSSRQPCGTNPARSLPAKRKSRPS
ncbi:MAG: hypothetical protein JWN43_2427 [Gammaproteobacteria bacterium]|nr:hypothetical protein [Gammaproteobacteria bacterium]